MTFEPSIKKVHLCGSKFQGEIQACTRNESMISPPIYGEAFCVVYGRHLYLYYSKNDINKKNPATDYDLTLDTTDYCVSGIDLFLGTVYIQDSKKKVTFLGKNFEKLKKALDDIKSEIKGETTKTKKKVSTAFLNYDIITSFMKFGKVTKRIVAQFEEFKNFKLHPVLFDESYNINNFNSKLNKVFTEDNAYFIGPDDHKKKYIEPTGWTRYGLKVLDGRYGSSDSWLKPLNHPDNWYIAYHGTSAYCGKLILNGKHDDQYRAKFKAGRCQAFLRQDNANSLSGKGKIKRGIYFSSDPKFAEQYSKTTEIQTTQGPKKYKFMFQVCVNPQKIQICSNLLTNWVMPDEYGDADVRPIGILIKECV